ncbi:hypothetical protein [Paraburkholderia sp. BL25I1N1]|uniref:hypothetical protein n=1 Tax=Paraburkholderia sp. BL25I1N1 TaxID=1938804 RepID=UPI0011B23D5C|nr:hypothetical protein [Paraburkholderia sp. BL25I1N1]
MQTDLWTFLYRDFHSAANRVHRTCGLFAIAQSIQFTITSFLHTIITVASYLRIVSNAKQREVPKMMNTPAHVFRSILTSGAQFEEYVDRIGRPRFAISIDGDETAASLAQSNEWLFADDIDCLMHAFLDSDKGAQRVLLETMFNNAWRYGFVALCANRYDSFIEEWKADDDKNARPDHYRAQKYFGVIVDAGEIGFSNAPLQYWVFIGSTSGCITAEQLHGTGLTYEGLIGQLCVINGLCEVERIGNHRIAERSAA